MKVRAIRKPSGAIRYQLDAGKINGQRVQKSFKTRELANAALAKYKAQQKAEGNSGLALSEADRIRFLEAKDRLAAAGATLDQAVSYFLAHTRPQGGTIPLADLIQACIQAKRAENKRERYLTQLRSSGKSFASAGHSERLAHEITGRDVEKWLHGNGWQPKTKQVYLTDLKTIFAWGVSKGFLTLNPCATVIAPTIEDKPVEIYEVSTCKKLLDAALATDPELGLLGYIAINMLAGIRPEERLSWQHVHLEDRFIAVPAAISKTRKRRIVTISENLAAWLARATCALHGTVAPIKWLTKRRAALKKTAGITEWPHDVLRHCFASYHLAAHGSAEKTSHQLGHEDTQMLFQHYREIVRPRDAAAFWSMLPPDL